MALGASELEQTGPLVGASGEESGREAGPPPGRRRLRPWALGAAALSAAALAALAVARAASPGARAAAARPGGFLGLAEDAAAGCKKVYIDTDAGIDDNIALMAAFGQHQQGNICIIGIGVTDGNIPAWISHNTFPKLLSLFGMEDLPFSTPAVPEGKSGDMEKLYADTEGKYQPPGGRGSAEHIHGKDGMGGLGKFVHVSPKLKFPNRDKDGNPAAFLEQRLKQECGDKDCDLLVIGPLTNVVVADKAVLAKHVNRTIWMGGSFVRPQEASESYFKGVDYVPITDGDWNVGLRRRGNIAPLSEFNAWAGSQPLAAFLTERDESVGFDMIPLDVTSKLMWSPALMDDFEQAAGAEDKEAWDSKGFRDKLMEFRAANPGTNKENNRALGKKILAAFKTEMAVRKKSNFSYSSTPSGRAAFIRDISIEGWGSTVADGQIPQKAVANLAHDVAVLAYEMNSNLFDAGEVEDVSVVVKGTAKSSFWNELEDDGFMKKDFKNSQLGAAGAPIGNDLKGAVFEPKDDGDADLAEDFSEKDQSTDLKIQTGKARVVDFAQFPGQPNKAPDEVMDWLVKALALATK